MTVKAQRVGDMGQGIDSAFVARGKIYVIYTRKTGLLTNIMYTGFGISSHYQYSFDEFNKEFLMNGLSQTITIAEFQKALDAQKLPAFLRKIASVAKPADVRMLKASDNGEVQPQTSWAGWR